MLSGWYFTLHPHPTPARPAQRRKPMRLTERLALTAAVCTLAAACADTTTAPARTPDGARGIFNGNGKVDGDDEDCTGSLISPTVFLTAAHCVEFLAPGTQVYVSFEPKLYP